MSGGYKTDVQIGQASAQQIEELAQRITNGLNTIKSTLDGLQSGWQGADAAQFVSLGTQIHQDCNQISNLIATIGEKVGTNMQTYSAAQQEREGIISRRLSG